MLLRFSTTCKSGKLGKVVVYEWRVRTQDSTSIILSTLTKIKLTNSKLVLVKNHETTYRGNAFANKQAFLDD